MLDLTLGSSSGPCSPVSAPPSPSKPNSRFQVMLAKRQLREKALRLWRLLRGVVNVLLFFLLRRRCISSVELVKLFLRQLGEADRIKYSMHRLTRKLRMINSCCRTYVKRRRKRLANMNQTWQEVEDRHLSDHFQSLAIQLTEETDTKRSEVGKDGLMLLALDWKRFRIPQRERE